MALPKISMPGMEQSMMPSSAPVRPQLDKLGGKAGSKKSDGSVFAPFGFDSKGNPNMTPPPGWKYFAYDGTPVAPAPKTGGWSPSFKVDAVFGPEAQAPDFADTGAEGADMYEKGLLSPDQVFLKIGAPLKIKLAPATKKTKGPDQRRSGAKIAM